MIIFRYLRFDFFVLYYILFKLSIFRTLNDSKKKFTNYQVLKLLINNCISQITHNSINIHKIIIVLDVKILIAIYWYTSFQRKLVT